MRLLIISFFISMSTLVSLSVAATVNVNGLGRWTMTPIAPNTPESEFTQNAEAALTLGVSKDQGPQISVFLYSRNLPADLPLGADKANWHNFFFTQIKAKKVSLVDERVTQEHGHWRYQAEFLADDGSRTQLHCIVSAVIADNKVKYLSYQHEGSVYQSHIRDVRKLFHDVDLDIIQESVQDSAQ